MTHSVVTQQLAKQLDRLPFERQRKVLDFALALAPSPPKGTSGQQLLRFAGTIHPDDAQMMTQAIENGCEQVDADEW
jgi:hypothetical protein